MKKGFSLIALMMTITIIMILLSTATFSIISTTNMSKKNNFATEINMVQEAVNAYYTSNNVYPSSDIVIVDIGLLSNDQKEQFTKNDEDVISDKVNLSKIDYTKIDITNLKYGNLSTPNDMYAVSEKTGVVYYVKGIVIGDTTFYTLTDSLKNVLNINKDNNIKDAGSPVIFEPTDTKYTNNDVYVKVKVPSTYSVISVYMNNTAVAMTSVEDGFNIYNVQGNENYSVIVNYNEKSSTYNVTNVDKSSPVLEISEFIPAEENSSDIVGYYRIISKSDNLSGIRKIKYDNEIFNDTDLIKDHFEVSGFTVDDDIILVKKGVKSLTVYAEDNAGNWVAKFIER